MTSRGAALAKTVTDPVERARLLRAERQSKSTAAGSKIASPAKPGAARPASGTAPVIRTVTATTGAHAPDRTAGARKKRDHLAPKKVGVDTRLSGFQSAQRTIKRHAGPADAAGGEHHDNPHAEDPHPEEHAEAEDGDDPAAEAQAEAREDAQAKQRAAGATAEDWFEKLRAKEQEERERKEEEERVRRREQEKQEKERRDEELKQRRKEDEEARRRALEEQRASRLAEKREKSEREREERLKSLEEERIRFLKEAGVDDAPTEAGEPCAQAKERTARKARIAELVAKVKSATIEAREPEAAEST